MVGIQISAYDKMEDYLAQIKKRPKSTLLPNEQCFHCWSEFESPEDRLRMIIQPGEERTAQGKALYFCKECWDDLSMDETEKYYDKMMKDTVDFEIWMDMELKKEKDAEEK